MVFENKFKLLVATGTTSFFSVVLINSEEDVEASLDNCGDGNDHFKYLLFRLRNPISNCEPTMTVSDKIK